MEVGRGIEEGKWPIRFETLGPKIDGRRGIESRHRHSPYMLEPHEARITSSVGRIARNGAGARPSRRRNNSSAAVRPSL